MSWPQPHHPQQHPYPQPHGQHPLPAHPPAHRSRATAVVALVTGILSLLLVALLGPFTTALGLAAVTTGAIALTRRLPGRGLALAGLITGAVGVVVSVVVTAVIVVLTGGVFVLGALAQTTAGEGGGYGSSEEHGETAGDVAFGEEVALDEYAVTVQAVQARGDVVFADLTVRFTGTGTGDSYEDLYGYLYDAAGDEHAATDCQETLTPDAFDLPDLFPGESVAFQMCFDGVADASGAWVTVVDDEGWGTSANWTDPVTLEGSSSTGV